MVKRKRLTSDYLIALENELFERGYKFTDIPDGYFAIIQLSVLESYRKVPKMLIYETILNRQLTSEEIEEIED